MSIHERNNTLPSLLTTTMTCDLLSLMLLTIVPETREFLNQIPLEKTEQSFNKRSNRTSVRIHFQVDPLHLSGYECV